MELIADWKEIKSMFHKSFKSSFHFAVATATENGDPHVTPIGSLILGRPGHGFYFEKKFTKHLPLNFETNKKVCVLAVNSSKWFWLKSLMLGRFTSPPALRLHGVAGALREATDAEIALWQKRVKRVRFSKGHAIMWRNMKMVRDIEFTGIEPVHMEMTRNLWKQKQQYLNSQEEKSHKVVGGIMKAGEATINVAYTFASAPPSSGFVIMKQVTGKWVFSSFGGSGFGTVSGEAGGQADLGSSGKSRK